MNKSEYPHFQAMLTTEKSQLEKELGSIGQKNSSAPGGWDATSGNIEVDTADDNEVADKLEELEDNSGIVSQLESQLNEVRAALDRIDNGSYGICEVCGKPIEKERLEANPSARSSIKHAH